MTANQLTQVLGTTNANLYFEEGPSSSFFVRLYPSACAALVEAYDTRHPDSTLSDTAKITLELMARGHNPKCIKRTFKGRTYIWDREWSETFFKNFEK